MKQYMMALDAGTTSSRCILFDHNGNVCAMAQKEFTQYYPQPGWVEHDANEIWQTQLEVAKEAMKQLGVSYEHIAGIGITNQRETTVVWDRYTGQPIYHAIVWQCRRTASTCDALVNKGYTDLFKEKTGLVLDAYFSGTKIQWILDHVAGAREKAKQGDLLFGTIDTWLIWNLTKGQVHVTDVTNASRTLLFNIHTLEWDTELLDILSIPKAMLPEVKASSEIYGYSDLSIFKGKIAISGAAGDQQCALFGQACFETGDVKNTYGTGGFLLMNTGQEAIVSNHGLVTTIAWKINNTVTYALEGSVFVAGAAIQWLRDELGLLEKSSDSYTLASTVEDTNGCYVVPAFTGLGAPYWDPYARGVIVGLTRGVNKNHIVRATLESLAYQVNDVIKAMESDANVSLSTLKVDGGASANDLLLEMQANLCQAPVIRPKCVETTAMGAAYLAGLAVGYWSSLEEVRENWQMDCVVENQMDDTMRNEKIKKWKQAVSLAKGWEKE